MTPAQYRLHSRVMTVRTLNMRRLGYSKPSRHQYRLMRLATMRAAMRASAQFLNLAAGVRSGCWPADLVGFSDRAPGAEPHNRAPELMVEADMARERLRAVA